MKKSCELLTEWNSFKVSPKEIQLKSVLTCGQSFRWKNNPDKPNEWTGIFNHHVWTLKQNEDTLFYKIHNTNNQQHDDKNINKEDLLKNYFQLNISLTNLYKEWSIRDNKFEYLTQNTTEYQGIRILKQDPIETLFAFICSSNNNIKRITQMINKLCINYGDQLIVLDGDDDDDDKQIYYDFPKVDKLQGDLVQQKLKEQGFGYRAPFIVNSAQQIVKNGGEEWVNGLAHVGYDEARKQLQCLPGIGRKVADCICLMGLGYHNVIPIDTHMHQVGKQYLPHLAHIKTLTDKVYTEINEYFQGIYGEYSGWAHSVLFASTLRHLKVSEAEHHKDKCKINGKKESNAQHIEKHIPKKKQKINK